MAKQAGLPDSAGIFRICVPGRVCAYCLSDRMAGFEIMKVFHRSVSLFQDEEAPAAPAVLRRYPAGILPGRFWKQAALGVTVCAAILGGVPAGDPTFSLSSAFASEKDSEEAAAKAENGAEESLARADKADGPVRNADDPDRTFEIPRPLSQQDAERYRQIFALQEKGKWSAANRLIAKLEDDVLMGHVQAQRYLHPTHYRSRYSELKTWLSKYHDHPDAAGIYRLAKSRKPRNAAWPHRPTGRFLVGYGGDFDKKDSRYQPRKSAWARRVARSLRGQISRYIRRGYPSGAVKVMQTGRSRQVFDRVERDQMWARIAAGYFYANLPDQAWRHASGAAGRSGAWVPSAYWYAGLSAWKLGNFEQAHKQFSALASSERAGTWSRAAGAYWASRTSLKLGKFEDVTPWLKKAAETPRSLYGQLSIRALGLEDRLNWDFPEASTGEMRRLLTDRAGRRALALLQIGRDHDAEGELRAAWSGGNDDVRQAITAVSARSEMPSLAMYLAWLSGRRDERVHDVALYPVPGWKPATGFSIDRALLYALMRQESAFQPRAKSHVGARGLMQVMPQTAMYVARTRNVPGVNRVTMYEPETNIALGQGYVEHLLVSRFIDDNLFHVISSYNAGPGNVMKWHETGVHAGDALMFIESIPIGETRSFVERVMTNYWIYRQRLGQDTPSMDHILAADWPRYEEQEEHERSRVMDASY